MFEDIRLFYYPDPILRNISRLIERHEMKFAKQLSRKMFQIMQDNNGAGLSAIQVGYPIQLFVFEDKICINPNIVYYSTEITYNKEGCLSIPGKYIEVKRSKIIKLNYLNTKRELKNITLYDMDAFIVQHEVDHLNGKLIVDYENAS